MGLSLVLYNKLIEKIYIYIYINMLLLCIFSSANSIGDADPPQPGEIVFDTMIYRRSETVQISGDFNNK